MTSLPGEVIQYNQPCITNKKHNSEKELEAFNTSITQMNRPSRQKFNKETQVLIGTLGQIDLTDIYRTIHLKVAEYTFYSTAHGKSSKLEYIYEANQASVNLRKLKSHQASIFILKM